ncbi:hypothetical protein Tco_1384833 [Tanacetum coccineum]
MADNRTMAQLLQAPTEGYEDAIVIPEINANFELKHGLINLVQNKQFFREHEKGEPLLTTSNYINDTFYKCPLNANDQDSLNSAAGGNFLDKMPRECLRIIENVAALTTEVSELKNMMKTMLIDKQKAQAPAPIKAVEQSCVTCGGAHSYRNCPATDGVSKTDFENYVKANDAVLRNMQNQGQGLQNQMTNLTDMLSKFVNSNTPSSSNSGSLPSNTVTNSKEDLKGITTRSGNAYQGPTIPTSSPKVVERRTEVTKDMIFPTNNEITEDIQPPVVPVEKQNPVSEPDVAPVSAPMPNQKPSIPYPSRRNDEKHRENANEQKEKFYEIFKDMSFEISFVDALTLMPKFASTLKALIRNKEKLSEMARTPLNEHCSAEVLGFLDVIVSANPTPYYDPIVSTSSPTLTLFGDSDFLLLEEADAFLALVDDPTLPEKDYCSRKSSPLISQIPLRAIITTSSLLCQSTVGTLGDKNVWHYARDDFMFTTIRVISKHKDTQEYDVILPQHLTNQSMLESKAFKTYRAYDTGEKAPKLKATKKKTDSESSPKTKPSQASKGKRIKTSAKGDKPTTTKSKGLTVLSEVALLEVEQMKLATKRSLKEFHISHASSSGDDFVHPNLSTYIADDQEKVKEEEKVDDDDDDVTSDKKVSTPPDYELAEESENEQDDDTYGRRTGDEENGELYETRILHLKLELKKSLMDKMEENNSIDRSDVQKNLYRALLKAYNSDKDLLSSYGEASLFKKRSMIQGLMIWKNHFIKFDTGNDDVSPVREATNVDERLWNPSGSRTPDRECTTSSFNEFLATPIDFSAFIMNQLNIQHLTQDLLTSLTYDLIKGTCKSLMELEYHLEEVFKATNNQLDWHNPEGRPSEAQAHIPNFNTKDKRAIELRHIIGRVADKDSKGKVTNLNVDERFALNVALRMYTRRIVIQERVEDLQLAVESYQKKINLTKPDTYHSDISKKTPYTAYRDIQGIIYQDDMNRNRLMRTDELHKFSDGTLNHVRTSLNDIATGIQMEYLPKRKWSKQDKQRARVMIKAIDKKLKDRRLMRSLEKFVGGRPYKGDLWLLQRTI